jgi:disulfide bond formation protein DsbB
MAVMAVARSPPRTPPARRGGLQADGVVRAALWRRDAGMAPACQPTVAAMRLISSSWRRTSRSAALKTLISGTGECAAVDWTFLRLSIAEWSLVCFAALFLYSLWLISSRRAG